MASTTTSSRRSTSPGRRSKAASVRIGACSTPRAQPKFSWTGPITDPDYLKRAGLAVLLGLLLSLPILTISGATATQTLMLAAAANLVGAWFAAIVALLEGPLLRAGRRLRAGSGHPAPGAARRHRAGAHRGDRRRRLRPAAAPFRRRSAARSRGLRAESVDPHPGLLRTAGDVDGDARCRGAARLSPISNASWSSTTRPIRRSGGRSKSIAVRSATASNSSGSKSSPATRPARLRLALAHTAADAEIIGVIDADYVGRSGLAQGSGAAVRRRARRPGAVAAGPSRRRPLADAPRHERRICRLLRYRHGAAQRGQRHHRARHDVPASAARRSRAPAAGRATPSSRTPISASPCSSAAGSRTTPIAATATGSLPDTFEAYKRQRHRWAFGGFQIVRKHWRQLLPWADGLTREQKREYGLGWLNWLGADSIGVVVALLNIVWVPVVAFANIAVPDRILTLPILAAFVVVGRPLRHALSPARAGAGRAHARRGVCRDGAAMDGGACGRHRGAQGTPALPAHGQGRHDPQGAGFPGLLGGGDRRTAAHRRR